MSHGVKDCCILWMAHGHRFSRYVSVSFRVTPEPGYLCGPNKIQSSDLSSAHNKD